MRNSTANDAPALTSLEETVATLKEYAENVFVTIRKLKWQERVAYADGDKATLFGILKEACSYAPLVRRCRTLLSGIELRDRAYTLKASLQPTPRSTSSVVMGDGDAVSRSNCQRVEAQISGTFAALSDHDIDLYVADPFGKHNFET